jgi:hypothetical protein
MRYVRTVALAALAVVLCLLLAACADDIDHVDGGGGGGPPPAPPTPSRISTYSASCSIAPDGTSLSVTITNTGNVLLELDEIDGAMFTASGAPDGTFQAPVSGSVRHLAPAGSQTFTVTPSGGVPSDAASCKASLGSLVP